MADKEDPSLDVAGARPSEPLALPLARARVAQELFGEKQADAAVDVIGRFRVLERLGAGGMGVVYAAYDPDLDRGVALKLVRVRAQDQKEALAEARALARLSHPNVVPIFDVGMEGDQVLLVMELVRGPTLAQWVAGRSWQEIVGAYRHAGEGLAAAHAAGLVHRDFKPGNAMVGKDGRVRVVDFGLACEADQAPGAAGTPGYMAPEQHRGAPVTAAADQYSLCVALKEALAAAPGERTPRWVTSVITRGLSADASARFPSMEELVRALGRDPARVWRQRLLAAALALAAGLAFVAGRSRPAGLSGECERDGRVIEHSWDASVVTRVGGLGRYGRALAPRLSQAVGEMQTAWKKSRVDACLAHARGRESDSLFDRRVSCLERSRAALSTLSTIGAEIAEVDLPNLTRALRSLPDPATCDEAGALLAGEAPPKNIAARVEALRLEVARASVELGAGKLEEARKQAAAVVEEARTLAFAPLIAEALLVEGHAVMLETREPAAPLLNEAVQLAVRANLDGIAVEAWARRAWAVSGAEALAGRELVEALAERLAPPRFERALLYNNLGTVELTRNQRPAAQAAFERAQKEARGVTGPGALELLAVRPNLALVTDDPGERRRLLQDASSELERLLGADHPDTLQSRWQQATMASEGLAPTESLLAPVCEGYELHPKLEILTVDCWAELGFVRWLRDEREAAVAAMERAQRLGVEHDSDGMVEPYLALFRGRTAEAVRGFEAAVRLPVRSEWWEQYRRGVRLIGLGEALRRSGEMRRARAALQQAIAILAPIESDHPASVVERRLGRARAELEQLSNK